MSTFEKDSTSTCWQDEWPTEAGYWWFYGKTFESSEIEWHFVEVLKTRTTDAYTYVTNGHFIYKEEGAVGRWTRVQFPEL